MHSQQKKPTQQITTKYKKQILPYQLLIQAISHQNKQLYDLQKKYQQMLQTLNTTQLPLENQSEHLNLKSRTQQRILQRKLFAEEALIACQQNYQKQFKRKVDYQESQNKLMKELISMDGENTVNVFMSLQEGILNKLLEYSKIKKDDEKVIGHIRYWKNTYSEAKKKIQQSCK